MKTGYGIGMVAALAALTNSTQAATTGWNQTAPGTYDYATTGNWVAGTINDAFDASLSLADDTVTGNQTLTFGANYTTTGALSFAHTDANTTGLTYNLLLRADGVADHTLTLGGNLTFTPVRATTRQLTIGSAGTNEKLGVDLGGANRTFNVGTVGGTSSGDPGGGVTLLNAVTNGSITKTGAGWLRLNGLENNTISGLTVSAGVLSLGKTATTVDAVAGDILINGGSLVLGQPNQIANTANITLSSGALYFASSSSSGSGNIARAETINNLTISGGTFNSSPKSNGSSSTAIQTVLGTMSVTGGTISLRNSTTFNANRVEVTTSTITMTSVGSNLATNRMTDLTIGSGGLEITNTASSAYNGISAGVWSRLTLNGNVVFNGNGTNANTSAILAATSASGLDTRILSLNGGTRTFTVNDGAADVDLLLDVDWTIANGTGTGALTKAGTGTLQIDSAGTYTGATTVSAGRLLVTGVLASPAIVNAGTLGGTGTISGGITVNAGTLAPGASIGQLNAGSTTFADNSIFAVEIGAASASDLLAVTGNLDLSSLLNTLTVTGTADGSSYVIATYTGTLTGAFETTNLPAGYTVDYGTGTNSAITLVVPEPASLALFGLVGLGALRRRRA